LESFVDEFSTTQGKSDVPGELKVKYRDDNPDPKHCSIVLNPEAPTKFEPAAPFPQGFSVEKTTSFSFRTSTPTPIALTSISLESPK
jgi:hypothetical protein